MNKIGDMCSAKDRGFDNYHRYIWLACEDCGKERWVALEKRKPQSRMCPKCSLKRGRSNRKEARKRQIGENASNWKGGRRRTPDGYIRVHISKDELFYPMASKHNSDCLEHRLIMARHLNRCLFAWEVVHHKNGIRDDNRLENLELMTSIVHHAVDTTLKAKLAKLTQRVELLESRVIQLEAENILLRKGENVSVQ